MPILRQTSDTGAHSSAWRRLKSRGSGCWRLSPSREVAATVKDAIRLGAISFDAVNHLVLCQLEGRPPRLYLDLYPYLPRVRVSTTSARDYMNLLSGKAA